jgi:hypothetical protein
MTVTSLVGTLVAIRLSRTYLRMMHPALADEECRLTVDKIQGNIQKHVAFSITDGALSRAARFQGYGVALMQ